MVALSNLLHGVHEWETLEVCRSRLTAEVRHVAPI